MSIPPATIRIKRKATDKPVDFLRVQESNNKKQRLTSEFVFARHPGLLSKDAIAQTPPTPEDHRLTDLSSTKQSLTPSAENDGSKFGDDVVAAASGPAKQSSMSLPVTVNKPFPPEEASILRQFHIAKSSKSRGNVTDSGIRKRPSKTAIFVEHKAKQKQAQEQRSSDTDQSRRSPAKDTLREPSIQNLPFAPSITLQQPRSADPAVPSSSTLPKPRTALKRPGQRARIPSSVKTTTAGSDQPPQDNKQNFHVDFDSEKFAALMDAFNLNESPQTDESAAIDKPEKAPDSKSQPVSKWKFNGAGQKFKRNSRFKPKHVLPLHQRDPERFAAIEEERKKEEPKEQGEGHGDEETDIDGTEYVYDTYYRMPASEYQKTRGDKKKEGVLLFDSDEEFNDDEQEGKDQDEDDENAEDHYTNDYPEEELSSDDEYDRNPEKYSTNHHVEGEEYNDDDVADTSMHPWSTSSARARKKMPKWMKEVKGIVDDDSDEEIQDEDDDTEEEYEEEEGGGRV